MSLITVIYQQTIHVTFIKVKQEDKICYWFRTEHNENKKVGKGKKCEKSCKKHSFLRSQLTSNFYGAALKCGYEI